MNKTLYDDFMKKFTLDSINDKFIYDNSEILSVEYDRNEEYATYYYVLYIKSIDKYLFCRILYDEISILQHPFSDNNIIKIPLDKNPNNPIDIRQFNNNYLCELIDIKEVNKPRLNGIPYKYIFKNMNNIIFLLNDNY